MGRTTSEYSREGREGETRSREPADPPEPPTQPESVPNSASGDSPEEHGDADSSPATEAAQYYSGDESDETVQRAQGVYDTVADDDLTREISDADTDAVDAAVDESDVSTAPEASEESERAIEYDPEIHESPTNLQRTTESEADAETEVERGRPQVRDFADTDDGPVTIDDKLREQLRKNNQQEPTREQQQQAQTDQNPATAPELKEDASYADREEAPDQARTGETSGSTLEASRTGGTASDRAQATAVTQANADQFDSEQIRTVDGQKVAVTGDTEAITQEREEEILGEKARQLNRVEEDIAALRDDLGDEEFAEIRDEIIRNYNDTGDATPDGFEHSSLKAIADSQAGETMTVTGLTKYLDSPDHEQTLRNSIAEQDERRTEASRDATDAPELTETTNFLDVDDDQAGRYERNGAIALNTELTSQQRQSILNLAEQRLPDEAVRSDAHETLAAQALGQAAVPTIDPSVAEVDQNTTAGDLLKQGNNSLAVTHSEYVDAMQTISQTAYSGDSAEFERFRPDTRQDRRQVSEFAQGPSPTVQDAFSELQITVSGQASVSQPLYRMSDRLSDDLGIGSRTFRQEVGSAMTRPAEADGSGKDWQIFESKSNPLGEDTLEFTNLEKTVVTNPGHMGEHRFNTLQDRVEKAPDKEKFTTWLEETDEWTNDSNTGIGDRAVVYNSLRTETEVGLRDRDDPEKPYIGRGGEGRDTLQSLIDGDIEISTEDGVENDAGWLGNPHRLEGDIPKWAESDPRVSFEPHTRTESVEKYEETFFEAASEVDGFAEEVADLHGKTLGCHCRDSDTPHHSGDECHGDVLAVAAEAAHHHPDGADVLKQADSLADINPVKPGDFNDENELYKVQADNYDDYCDAATNDDHGDIIDTHTVSLSDVSGELGEAYGFAKATKNGDFTEEMNQAVSLAAYTNYEGQTVEDADTIARIAVGQQVAHGIADDSESPPPEDVTIKGDVTGILDPDDMANEYDEEGYYVTVNAARDGDADSGHDVKVLIRKQATRRLRPTSDPSEPGFESLPSGDVDELKEGDTITVTGEVQIHNIHPSDLRLDGFGKTSMAGEDQSAANGRISIAAKDDQHHGATVMNTDTGERDFSRTENNEWIDTDSTHSPDTDNRDYSALGNSVRGVSYDSQSPRLKKKNFVATRVAGEEKNTWEMFSGTNQAKWNMFSDADQVSTRSQGDSEPANTDSSSGHNATLGRDGPDSGPTQVRLVTWGTTPVDRWQVDTSQIDDLTRPDDKSIRLSDLRKYQSNKSPQ